MSLFGLANELLLLTGQFLDAERDIDALSRCNRRLYNLLTAYLYLRNAQSSQASALTWAAKCGRLETLHCAIAAGVKIHDYSLLPIAAQGGHKSCVDFLLATPGFDIDAKSEDGWTALAAASQRGHVGVVKSLLAVRPDLQINYAGWSPLNVAANDGHIEVVRLLLEKGADVSMPSETGWTPLKSAASKGHYDVVKLLLAHGASVHITAERFWTALHSAANSGHADIIELLMDHGACSAVATADGWTPLTLAADKGKADAVKALVTKGADVALPCGNGWSPITLASDSGHAEIVKILLANGADVNSTCNDGWTPLTLAAGAGNISMVNVLLEHGADISTVNDTTWSALLLAADRGHDGVVKALLSHGADVSTTNRAGLTALHAASENGHADIAQLLLASGADAKAGNKSGWSPLHIATHNNHPKLVELFLKTPNIDIDFQDNHGRTASYHAAMRGNANMVDLFLAHNVSVMIPDSYGSLPIFSAVRNGHEMVTRRLLAANTYSHHQLDGFGHTLLYWAVRSGRSGLLQLIQEHVQQQNPSFQLDHELTHPENPVEFATDACWCEVCTRCTVLGTISYECPTCDGGYFLVCAECHSNGIGCGDDTHELIRHQCNRIA